MRKRTIGALCALGLLACGCDTDIPADALSDLGQQDLCRLSGGTYKYTQNQSTGKNEGFCNCGGNDCGLNVNCGVDVDAKGNVKSVCGGVGYTFLTEGLCTMVGVEVCSDRVTTDGKVVGYTTTCGSDNRWTAEKQCDNKAACELYMFRGFAMSSRCPKAN